VGNPTYLLVWIPVPSCPQPKPGGLYRSLLLTGHLLLAHVRCLFAILCCGFMLRAPKSPLDPTPISALAEAPMRNTALYLCNFGHLS
jgi:hypothetical protein